MKKLPTLLKYFWKHSKKFKLSLFVSFVLFGVMTLISDVLTPVYIKKLTDSLSLGDSQNALSLMLIILVLYLAMRLALFVSMRALVSFESQVSRNINQDSFEHFTKHSYHFYTNNFTGSLVEKSARLGNNFIDIVDIILFQFFSLCVALVGILFVVFQENLMIGFIFVSFIVVYIILIRWMNSNLKFVFEERSRARSDFRGVASDILTNIQTMLFFGNKRYDLDKFKSSNNKFFDKQYIAWKKTINYQDGIGFIPPLFTVGVTFYAVHLFTLGALTTGSVILVFMLANNIQGSVWGLARQGRRLTSSISDCIEALEIIEQIPSVLDSINPEPLRIAEGTIAFDEVSFTYPDGEEVFKSFNLIIPSGQSIGVVGKSGSGKTSLTKLLLRLYDPHSGHIEIDEQNIAHIRQNDLKSKIAYVPQDTILFHRSIFENIKYGNLNASDEEVLEAARAAHVDEFVQDLEQGYETMVGERGIKLSGGQRQRVGIARAMLKTDAPVLIMDEATSSLDSLSEHYIQESFEELAKNRTTIVIAHRLSTIQKMDRIIVLEKGRIVEDGSHTELLEKRGYYAELWNSQVDGMIVD